MISAASICVLLLLHRIFVSCLCSDQFEFMVVFIGFNLRSGPGSIFEPVLNF